MRDRKRFLRPLLASGLLCLVGAIIMNRRQNYRNTEIAGLIGLWRAELREYPQPRIVQGTGVGSATLNPPWRGQEYRAKTSQELFDRLSPEELTSLQKVTRDEREIEMLKNLIKWKLECKSGEPLPSLMALAVEHKAADSGNVFSTPPSFDEKSP